MLTYRVLRPLAIAFLAGAILAPESRAGTATAQGAPARQEATLAATGVLTIPSLALVDASGVRLKVAVGFQLVFATPLVFQLATVTAVSNDPPFVATGDLATGRIHIPDLRLGALGVSLELTPLAGPFYVGTRAFAAPPNLNRLVHTIDVGHAARGFPTTVRRSYYVDSQYDGPLGVGWSHSYHTRVDVDGRGLAVVFNADGSRSAFTPIAGGGYRAPPGDPRTLASSPSGGHVLTERHGLAYAYDATGRLVGMTDRKGNLAQLGYDAFGRLETVTDSTGRDTTFQHDANGRLRSITDPIGRLVHYTYDAAGDLASVRDTTGATTTYEYDALHRLVRLTDAEGRTRNLSYDEFGRLVGFSHGQSVESFSISYGVPSPTQLRLVSGLGDATDLTYDQNRKVVRIVGPLGRETRIAYDSELRIVRHTAPDGTVTAITYDAAGNLKTLDKAGIVTSFDHEPAFGFIAGITDAEGNRTAFSYGSSGLLSRVDYPDGSAESFSYDAFGNLVQRTDRSGRTTTLEYDPSVVFVTKRSSSAGASETFTYDAAGHLASATNAVGTFVLAWNALGRLASVTDPAGDRTTYSYDATGFRTRMTYPDGRSLDYVYDGAGRMAEIRESGVPIVTDSYDSDGRLMARMFANGVISSLSYGRDGSLSSVAHALGAGAPFSTTSYSYDAVGNRTSMTNRHGTTTYAYDALNQLTSVREPSGAVTLYTYDRAGNRSTVTLPAGTVLGYSTNAVHQYLSAGAENLAWDANGNLTSKIGPAGTSAYSYDERDRLVSAATPGGTVTYTYDPFGRRYSKSTPAGLTRYIYDGAQLIMERDAGGGVAARYVHGASVDDIIRMERGGETYYYTTDGLGSVTEISDASGKVVESYRYNAFGAPDATSSVGNPFLFTGRPYEEEAGLYYYRARFYDPALGRFTSVDPLRFGGGVNYYAYALNDPVNKRDPWGERTVCRGPCTRWVQYYINITEFLDPISCEERAQAMKELTKRLEESGLSFQDAWVGYSGPAGSWAQLGGQGGVPWIPANEEGTYAGSGPAGGQPGSGEGLRAGDPTFIQPSEYRRMSSAVEPEMKGPLTARITVPPAGALVRAHVPICGIACGRNFESYAVQVGSGECPTEWHTVASSVHPRTEPLSLGDLDDSSGRTIYGNLATWDTGLRSYTYLPSHPPDHPVDLDGPFTIRLVVRGADGTRAEDSVSVVVGRVVPNAWGGTVTSSDGRCELRIKPQTLADSFRLFRIQARSDVPLPMADSRLLGPVYQVLGSGEWLSEPAELEIRLDSDGDRSAPGAHLLEWKPEAGTWSLCPTRAAETPNAWVGSVARVAPFYALAASNEALGEPRPSPPPPALPKPRDGQPFLAHQTFDGGTATWRRRHGRWGARVEVDTAATGDGTPCLAVVNEEAGGSFGVSAWRRPFDVADWPLLRFDYRLPQGVRTNLVLQVAGRWYSLGFSDDVIGRNQRVNLADLGPIPGIIADDAWHTVTIDMRSALRRKTGNTVVEEIGFADWDVPSYMRLEFGNENPAGARFWIDDFTIEAESRGGLRIAAEDLVVDDFNKGKAENRLGGATMPFLHAAEISEYGAFPNADGQGSSLRLACELFDIGGYVGHISMLRGLDPRDYQVMSLRIATTIPRATIWIGLRGAEHSEDLVPVSRYARLPSDGRWQTVIVPLAAFRTTHGSRALENFSVRARAAEPGAGELWVDDITLHRHAGELEVERFTGAVNKLGGPSRTFHEGDVELRTELLEAGGLRISVRGNIGPAADDPNRFTYAGWSTDMGGIDVSRLDALRIRCTAVDGDLSPNVYLDDGTFRACATLGDHATGTAGEYRVPLSWYDAEGVDLTHVESLIIAFEWTPQSGTTDFHLASFGGPPR